MPGETGSSKEALLSMRCLVLGDIRDVGDEDVDTDNFLKGLWSRKLLRPLLRFGERFFRMSNMFQVDSAVSLASGIMRGPRSRM